LNHCRKNHRYSANLHDLARLMLATGMRPAEVLALQVRDSDPARETLIVRAGKTMAARRTTGYFPANLPAGMPPNSTTPTRRRCAWPGSISGSTIFAILRHADGRARDAASDTGRHSRSQRPPLRASLRPPQPGGHG